MKKYGLIVVDPPWPKRPLIPLAFSAENIRHSQKPEKFYTMVAPLSDSRADIFARKKRSGWDVWGDEVVCSKKLKKLLEKKGGN